MHTLRRSVLLLFSLLLHTNAQIPFVSKCPTNYCFLRTYGDFSYFRVRIDGQNFQSGQNTKITDQVVYTTCFRESGRPPPCMGRSSLCKYFSNSLCLGASELGCEQPLLTTAVEMGCSSSLDPNCRDDFLGNGVAADTAGLWASMGGAWGTGEACGLLGTPEHGAVFCSSGQEFSADGTWWKDCATDTPPCKDAMGTRELEHYAFCVGRAVCTCVHGECDISSDMGYCLPGSCAAGFYGVNCNYLCTSAFCDGKNDPSVPNSVFVNTLNQCECICLPQYGPGGTGGCSECIRPGSHDCVAYTAEYLDTDAVITSAVKGSPIQIDVTAKFSANNQLDPNVDTDLLAELSPGGGNGNGLPFEPSPNPFRMTNGRASVRIMFGSACDACVITIRDLDTSNPSLTYRIKPLVMPPIQVIATGDRMRAITAPNGVTPGVPFKIALTVIDANSNIDRGANNRVRVALSGSTTGAVLTATASSNLEQQFNQGNAEWELTLSALCGACSLTFTDVSVLRTLADYVYGPLTGSGTSTLLRATQPPPQRVNRGETFTVIIDAVNALGNIDTTAQNTISLSLPAGGGAGNGGVLISSGLSTTTAQMVGGRATFTLSFTDSCVACIIRASDISGLATLGSLNLPPVAVSSSGTRLQIMNNIVGPFSVNQQFLINIAAVDDSGAVDQSDVSRVRLTLLAGGSNTAGGGELVVRDNLSTRNLLNGNTTAVVSLTHACDECVIKVEDLDDPLLAPTQTVPIEIRTTGTRLGTIGIPATVVAKDIYTDVRIGAVDASGGIDRDETGLVTMSLIPGGGNGGGGTLTNSLPPTLEKQLVRGEVLFTPTFSEACTACVLQFVYSNPNYAVLRLTPIKVTTKAIRLTFTIAPPLSVAPNEQFSVSVQAVDAMGNRDETGRSTISMKHIPDSTNGNGGSLLNDLGSSREAVSSVDGVSTFKPSFTESCGGCRLQFSDTGTTLPVLSSEPIQVSAAGTKLSMSSPNWALIGSTSAAATVAVGATLSLSVDVKDAQGFVAMAHSGTVTASLRANGGNGNGGNMAEVSGRGLLQKFVNGRATFDLVFDAACAACVVAFSTDFGIISTATPPFQITSRGTDMTSATTDTTTVQRDSAFPVVIQVVDKAKNVDELWASAVTLTLLSGGLNGGGGVLSASSGSLKQTFSKGVATFAAKFSLACDACFIEARDATSTLLPITIGPIRVTTVTTRLSASLKTVSQVVKDVPFTLEVSALDDYGSINRLDTSLVTAVLETVEGVPLGSAALQSSFGSAGEQTTGAGKRLVDGTASMGLILRDDCSSCVVRVSSDATAVDSFRLRTDGSSIGSPTTPTDSPSGDDGMNPLWVVLIVFLILVVLLAVALGAYFFLKRQKAKKAGTEKKVDNDNNTSDPDADEDYDETYLSPGSKGGGDYNPRDYSAGSYNADPDMSYPDGDNPGSSSGNPLDALFTNSKRGTQSWMIHDDAPPPRGAIGASTPPAPMPMVEQPPSPTFSSAYPTDNVPVPPATHFQAGEI